MRLVASLLVLLSVQVARAQQKSVESTNPTLTLECVVVDDQGKPIAGASAISSKLNKGTGYREWLPLTEKVETDSKGGFSIVVPDRESIHAVTAIIFAKGYAANTKMIPLEGLHTEPLTIRLPPSTPRQLRVTDKNEQPIRNAVLERISEDQANVGIKADDWKRLGHAIAKSDADGIIKLRGLTKDQVFSAQLSHADYACSMHNCRDAGDTLPTAILEKGIETKFRVTCTSDPAAVSQTTIVASISSETGYYSISTGVDEKGFAVLRLPDKYGTIRAYHPTLACEDWHHNGTRKCDFWLYPYGKLTGKVLSAETEKGAAGAHILVAAGDKVIAGAWTDENGIYIADVPANAAGLSVKVVPSGKWIPSFNGGEEFVRAKAGETVAVKDFSVRAKLPVRGRVLLEGKPVKNAIVISGFRDFVCVTGDDGAFSFMPRSNEDLAMQAYHPHKPLSGSIGIEGGTPPDVIDIKMKQDGTSIGLVTDKNQQPLAGIPVVVQGRFDFGGSSIGSIFADTTSRDDGTFRIVGLCDGMTFQPQVHGASRANSSNVPTETGAAKELGERRDRRPLVIGTNLLKEIRQQLDQKPKHPPKLIPFECSDWTNSKPIDLADLSGRSVLLCFGISPSPLKVCETAHQLYGDRGLVVIYLGRSLNELEPEYTSILADAKITFPTAHDNNGVTATAYGVGGVNDSFCLLYNKEGEFQKEVRWSEIAPIRNHMVYEHPRD